MTNQNHTGVTAMKTVDECNSEHEYCTECDCILRWDESETLCKSCEERIEKENLLEAHVLSKYWNVHNYDEPRLEEDLLEVAYVNHDNQELKI